MPGPVWHGNLEDLELDDMFGFVGLLIRTVGSFPYRSGFFFLVVLIRILSWIQNYIHTILLITRKSITSRDTKGASSRRALQAYAYSFLCSFLSHFFESNIVRNKRSIQCIFISFLSLSASGSAFFLSKDGAVEWGLAERAFAARGGVLFSLFALLLPQDVIGIKRRIWYPGGTGLKGFILFRTNGVREFHHSFWAKYLCVSLLKKGLLIKNYSATA
jgi:hypothetical protein